MQALDASEVGLVPLFTTGWNFAQTGVAKANAAAAYRCSYYSGPHKFDLAMQQDAFDWFDRWLKA